MVKPMLAGGEPCVILWNLSHDVGPGCRNQTDDVEFVRLGYHCMGINPLFDSKIQAPGFRERCANLPTSGGFDPDLASLIKEHQRIRGGTQDGKVSTIKNSSGVYVDMTGSHSWIIEVFNRHIRDMLQNDFPRIDKHAKAGMQLRTVARKCCNII